MYNYYQIPNNYMYSSIPKNSFKSIFSKNSFNSFLNGTTKTLNVINQAIPIYKQVKPIISNAKTMFRVMTAVKNTNNVKESNINIKHNLTNNPTFFI